MGQQQLLLLVLGIVIVGLAVVVGIQAFGENQKKANSDALVNDGVRIASDAQAWVLKPKAFGGGAGKFTGIDLTKLGYTLSDGTGDAKCAQGPVREPQRVLQALRLLATTGVTITGNSIPDSDSDNQVVIKVSGTAPSDIGTTVSTVDDGGS